MNNALAQKCHEALNTITKWRAIFCGWQLGTRLVGDPECDAVRDHREVSILQRVELSAIKQILVGQADFSQEDLEFAVAKWREGMVNTEDEQEEAVQEHRGVTLSMRVEISALTALLCEKGIMTLEDFQKAIINECNLLEVDYERRFPGIKATPIGMHFYDVNLAAETMKNWKL